MPESRAQFSSPRAATPLLFAAWLLSAGSSAAPSPSTALPPAEPAKTAEARRPGGSKSAPAEPPAPAPPPATTDEALNRLVTELSEVITHDPPPFTVYYRVPPPRLAGRSEVERYRAERARAARRFKLVISAIYPNSGLELADDGEYFIKQKVRMSPLRLLWLIADDSGPYAWDAAAWYAYGNPVAEALDKALLRFKEALEALPEEALDLSLFRDYIKALSALSQIAESAEKSVDRQRDVMRFLQRARIPQPEL